MNPDLVYLVQTDTTVGFLSNSKDKLNIAKKRNLSKSYITSFAEIKTLKKLTRLPKKYKKNVRNSKKTSFVVQKNNFSFRLINDSMHRKFILGFDSLFTTSANLSGDIYTEEYAYNSCDVVAIGKKDFIETKPSRLMQIGKKKIKKLR